MDFQDTPEQAAFRHSVRRFIRERFPKDYVPDRQAEHGLEPDDVFGYNWTADRKSADHCRREGALAWAQALAKKGWVAPHWPKEYGGAGLTVVEAFILQEEVMRAGVPVVNGIAVTLMGPTLLQHGTPAQCREHLPPISSGERVWAQAFSEPGAGSDLASLLTRAVRDGEHYVVNGQKVWTSLAQYADWLMVLVRTDWNATRKHRGITFLMIDAATPGITIRPIRDMRGDTPFAEVFFEGVRVPISNRVGEENRGFYVAMTTLGFERSSVGPAIQYERRLSRLIESMRSEEGRRFLREDRGGVLRHEIVQRWIEIRVLYDLALRTVSKQAAGEFSDYEASINQLFASELHQRLARTGVKAFGLHGNTLQRQRTPLLGEFAHDLLDSVASTFLGGTTEIQRNVIATRGLGLPRE